MLSGSPNFRANRVMIYVISDTHFGHSIMLEGTDFHDIDEYDRVVIENINGVLKRGDTLWHLGDVAWRRASYRRWLNERRQDVEYNQLRGNHDFHRLKSESRNWPDVKMFKYCGDKFFASHYPHLAWPSSAKYHVFGHCHGTRDVSFLTMAKEVSCNVLGHIPISCLEIIKEIANR